MTDVEKLQLIEDHYQGCLSESQQAEFDRLMSEEPSFVSEVDDYEFLFAGFDSLQLQAFEGQMRSWEQKYEQADAAAGTDNVIAINKEGSEVKNKGKFRLQRYIAAAAVVAGLLFTPLAYNAFTATPDAFSQLYVTPSPMGGVRGELTDKQYDYNEAMQPYLEKNYSKAVETLGAYVGKYGEKELEAMFFLGAAQLETKNFTAASMNFEHVMIEDKGIYGQQAQWLRVLAQYKLGNKELAVKFAQQIKDNPNHDYYKSAEKFLELNSK